MGLLRDHRLGCNDARRGDQPQGAAHAVGWDAFERVGTLQDETQRVNVTNAYTVVEDVCLPQALRQLRACAGSR